MSDIPFAILYTSIRSKFEVRAKGNHLTFAVVHLSVTVTYDVALPWRLDYRRLIIVLSVRSTMLVYPVVIYYTPDCGASCGQL